jgi:predicted  nucleic acid-binding Zn-ribbon protein
MESTFVWIVMFAGAAVALLGVFLVASERELKIKRREIEALLAKLENPPRDSAPTQLMEPQTGERELADLRTKNRELQNELAALSGELELSRNSVDSVQPSQPGTAAQMESQRLSAVNDQLTRELSELRSQLAASAAQLQGSASHSEDAQQDHARMQAEIDDLSRRLGESHAKIRELENARQNLPDLNAIETDHRLERQALDERIFELEKRLSTEQEKSSELQTLRDQLMEADGIQSSLRAEIRRHEEEIPRWQARILAAEEDRRHLAALQVPCNELLSKQAALADRQRQLQEELVAFAQLIATPADGKQLLSSAPRADAAERQESNSSPNESREKPVSPPVFSSISGRDAASAPTLEARTSQDAAHEPASAGASTEPRTHRFGILGMLLLVAATGALVFQFLSSESKQSPRRAVAASAPAKTAHEQFAAAASIPENTQQATIETPPFPAPPNVAEKAKPVVKEDVALVVKRDGTAKPEVQAVGTYKVIQPGRVYAAPNELSRSIGDIQPGINVNVVHARDGWLEIHSKHGRPPGFIRREVAARIADQN